MESILELIGNTPILRLRHLAPPEGATIWAKLEARNPGGSIKDRVVLAIVEEAEQRGELKPDAVIVEASGGNLGLSLAMVAAAKKYRAIIVMPESVSPEHRRLLLQLGAQVVLSPATLGMAGAVDLAQGMAKREGYFHLNAFERPANAEVHRRTTAQEILRAVEGRIDAFVCAFGTGGTLTGVGEVLKQKMAGVKVVAVEPARSPLLSQGRTGPHGIPGIGAPFLPSLLNRAIIDRIIAISDEDALETTFSLCREEGLLVGISSGANVWAALQVAQELPRGGQVVTILPDTGERYLNQMFAAEALAETGWKKPGLEKG